MDKIAVFGGTFNPFHNGHLEIIKAITALNIFEKILVIPTNIPPHKNAPFLASGEDRISMCKLALSGFENVKVCDIEFHRNGPSYTYDTICELKKQYNAEIHIVCGGDMITTLYSWKNYNDLIKSAKFVAFRRANVDNSEFDAAVEKTRSDGGAVTVIDIDITDVSSTEIRCGNSNNLPVAVQQYIREKGLYNVNSR